jgi:hypothetical protein
MKMLKYLSIEYQSSALSTLKSLEFLEDELNKKEKKGEELLRYMLEGLLTWTCS